ncbi:hypothetical protein D9M69_518750 [compost metagenome]
MRPRTNAPHFALFHIADRPRVARREGIEAVGVHLLHIEAAVDRARAHHRHTVRVRRRSHSERVAHVLRTVGRQGRGRTHRAGQHHRLGRREHGVQEEGGLFQRVGAVGDHDAGHVRLRQPVCAARGQLAPGVGVHVLAVELRDLLRHQRHAGRRLDAAQQVRHAHLSGGVADVVAAAGGLAGNGAAGAQHDHAARLGRRGMSHGLSTFENWLKIQVLDI